jgi:dolichyl-phosphate-mannose-protein mannosyltransferase
MSKPNSTQPPSTKGGPYANLKPETRVQAKKSHDDFTSDGVEDNDVFLLPVSDYQVMLLVTIIGAIVRLFRIYQPTSVVFDEVQYA